jgi:iron complex outermembrane recepter protein
MFKSLYTTAMLLLSMPLFGQEYSITGSVRDARYQQRLTGATVRISESNQGMVTDELGRFSFRHVQPGRYTLTVSFVGYLDKVEVIEVQQDVDVDFLLEEAIVMSDEVVVLSTRADERTPATFTNIDKKSIQKQNFGQDLPFLLNWSPSVVTTSDAGTGIGYTGLRIRGTDATRINVTINGIPYNDSESQGTFWVDIPDIASSSQSIQIQRGVGTSTNGAGAFGGTINLQTNSRNDSAYASIITSAGSFGSFRNTLSFGTGLLKERWVLDGRISNIVSDGFIDRASSALQSYYFSTGFYTGSTLIKAIAFGGKERTYQSWYGVPESRLNNDLEAMETTVYNEFWNEQQRQNLLNSNNRTFNPYTYKNQVDDYGQNHYQLHLSQRLSESLSLNASLHYTKGKGYYEEYRYNDDIANYGREDIIIDDDGDNADNDTISSTDIIRRRWLDNDFYGITFSLNYEKKNLNTIFGGAWNRYDGDHFGEILWSAVTIAPHEHQYYFNNGDKRDMNVFVKNNYQFTPTLSAYLDVQLRHINFKASGIENKQNAFDFKTDYTFFNPKAGLMFVPDANQQLYFSFSVANREPVRDDFTDASGNLFPHHETLHNVELGYRRTGKKYALSANYYLMDYSDQLVLTGALNDVGASLRTNVDKSYRMGIELEGIVKINHALTWNANLTLSKNKIAEFTEVLFDYATNKIVKNNYRDTDISFSPSVIAGSSFTYAPVKGLEATLLTKYVGKQYLDNTQNDDRSIDPYLVNDVRLRYALETNFIRQIALSFLVNNVLDEMYESNGYTWGYLDGATSYRENYYYPQAGRNFMAMLTLSF